MTIILHNIVREIFYLELYKFIYFPLIWRLLFRIDTSSYNVCFGVRVNFYKVRPVSNVVLWLCYACSRLNSKINKQFSQLYKLWWEEAIWINWNQPRGKICEKKKRKQTQNYLKKKKITFLWQESNPRPLICLVSTLTIQKYIWGK